MKNRNKYEKLIEVSSWQITKIIEKLLYKAVSINV